MREKFGNFIRSQRFLVVQIRDIRQDDPPRCYKKVLVDQILGSGLRVIVSGIELVRIPPRDTRYKPHSVHDFLHSFRRYRVSVSGDQFSVYHPFPGNTAVPPHNLHDMPFDYFALFSLLFQFGLPELPPLHGTAPAKGVFS